MPGTDMAEPVEHTKIGKDTAADDNVLEQAGIDTCQWRGLGPHLTGNKRERNRRTNGQCHSHGSHAHLGFAVPGLSIRVDIPAQDTSHSMSEAIAVAVPSRQTRPAAALRKM